MDTVRARAEIAIQNILVATDFSSTSERALRYATAIATRYNSKIHLVHIFNPTALGFLTPEAITGAYSEAYDHLRLAADERLKEQAGQLTDVRHQIHLLDGPTSEAVEAVVRENQIDLVVVGTRGSGGLEKLIFGSTARRSSVPQRARSSRLAHKRKRGMT